MHSNADGLGEALFYRPQNVYNCRDDRLHLSRPQCFRADAAAGC
ncbi:hypothetical protein Pla144_06930 [Bythopirellula polymerisocia]|uniref:Uncharacterized protein n=1 Tax=Bythopirellula polymerisocia TaxID=2528003 RepID=A0A5C6CZ54_9BACT|nr:hypothetical protein Pla144_06930 [Bythopirellula polymerisocia]